MMRQVMLLLLVACCASACGNRGKLKTPDQMAYEKEKEERRKARQAMGLPRIEDDEPAPAEQVDSKKMKDMPAMPSNNVAK